MSAPRSGDRSDVFAGQGAALVQRATTDSLTRADWKLYLAPALAPTGRTRTNDEDP
jgi:hypothetical protein